MYEGVLVFSTLGEMVPFHLLASGGTPSRKNTYTYTYKKHDNTTPYIVVCDTERNIISV